MSTITANPEASDGPKAGRRSFRPRLPERPTGWSLVGAVIMAILAIVLVIQASTLIVAMDHNADLAAPIAMAEYAHQYQDAQLVTGRLGWWGGLWFLQLIRPLPGNTYIGNYLPMLLTVAVAAILALQSRRLWGPRAPWILLLVALAVPAQTWINLASWSARAPSWWAMGLLGAGVLAASRPMTRLRSVAVAIAAVAACLVTAIAASGDQEATIALLPLAAAGLYALRMRRFVFGGVTIVAAIATFFLSKALETAAADHGYLKQAFPVHLIDFSDWGKQLGNLVIGLTGVWTGPAADRDLVSRMGTAGGYLGLMLVAVAAAIIAAAVWRVWLGRPAVEDAEVPAAPDGEDLQLQRGVWVTFWSVGLAVYLAAFWLTTAQGSLGQPVVRYLYGVPMAAAAAIVPLAASKRGRPLTAAAALLALLTVVGLISHPPKDEIGKDIVHTSTFGRIGQIAAENNATRGFAGYWMSYPLALQSGFKLDVTPVGGCSQAPGQLCAMYLHYIDQAYAPRPNTRSFLVVDTSQIGKTVYPHAAATELPPGLDPEKVVDAGDGVQVAIFGYDVASKIQGNRALTDPRVGRGGPLPPL